MIMISKKCIQKETRFIKNVMQWPSHHQVENMEYHFTVITPRSTLDQIDLFKNYSYSIGWLGFMAYQLL